MLNCNLLKGMKLCNYMKGYRGPDVPDIWQPGSPTIGSNVIYSEYQIPYCYKNLDKKLNKFIYFSGAYWIAMKKSMKQVMLNIDLLQGQGEDVDWSQNVNNHFRFALNEYSTVKLQKYKAMSSVAPEEHTTQMIKTYLTTH